MAADSHYRESVREYFTAARLQFWLLPEGREGKVDQYMLVRVLLAEGRLQLPDDPKLVSQFKAVLKRPTSGGKLSIYSPRTPHNGHGDLVSAVVAAVWRAYGKNKDKVWQRPEIAPVRGTAEASDREGDEDMAASIAAVGARRRGQNSGMYDRR